MITHGTILRGEVAGRDYTPIPGETRYGVGLIGGELISVTLAHITVAVQRRVEELYGRQVALLKQIEAEPSEDLAERLADAQRELQSLIGAGAWPEPEDQIEAVVVRLMRDFTFVLTESSRRQASGSAPLEDGPQQADASNESPGPPVILRKTG